MSYQSEYQFPAVAFFATAQIVGVLYTFNFREILGSSNTRL